MNIHCVINGIRLFLWRLTKRVEKRLRPPLLPKGVDYTIELLQHAQDAAAEARHERMKLLGAMYAEDEGLLKDE